MSDKPRREELGIEDDAPREAEESREAAAEGESPQDFAVASEAAEGRTSFDDDTVTPRLNDGR